MATELSHIKTVKETSDTRSLNHHLSNGGTLLSTAGGSWRQFIQYCGDCPSRATFKVVVDVNVAAPRSGEPPGLQKLHNAVRLCASFSATKNRSKLN